MAKKESLVRHVIHAFHYSVAGLRFAFTKEYSFRWETLLFVVLIPAGLWMGENALERLLAILAPLLILIIELLNTAIEVVVNLILDEKRHPLAKAAKDMGSAAVMLGFIGLGSVWLYLLV